MESSELLELYYALREEYEEIVRRIAEYEILKDGLKDLKEGETYVNLGGFIFVKVDVKDTNKILVNVGDQTFVEKSKEDVINTLSKAIEELEKAKRELEVQLDEIKEKIRAAKR